MKVFRLNNGSDMPSVGIGTYLLEPKDAENSVITALNCGYNLVDTANAYANEVAVGRGMKRSGKSRGEIFLSTKLWPSKYENPNAVNETLARLGTDYIDLLFLHQPTDNWREGYKQLLRAKEQGKIRNIGVSNFEGKYIDELLKEFTVRPQVIQVECHPFYPQEELRKTTEPEGIRIMSWYPLGGKGMTAGLLNDERIKAIAKKHGKSTAQVVLRWHVQSGFVVIPGSRDPEHIKDNVNIFDFSLDGDDMASIATLNSGTRRYTRTDEALRRFAEWKITYEKF